MQVTLLLWKCPPKVRNTKKHVKYRKMNFHSPKTTFLNKNHLQQLLEHDAKKNFKIILSRIIFATPEITQHKNRKVMSNPELDADGKPSTMSPPGTLISFPLIGTGDLKIPARPAPQKLLAGGKPSARRLAKLCIDPGTLFQ